MAWSVAVVACTIAVGLVAVKFFGSEQSKQLSSATEADLSQTPPTATRLSLAEPAPRDVATPHETFDRSSQKGGPSFDRADWAADIPYDAYDDATLAGLAASGDVEAAERLSRRVYRASPEEGQYHALAAAAMGASPDPLMTMVSAHMGPSQAREALPYVLLAQKLGSRVAEHHIDAYVEQGHLSPQDVREARKEADRLYATMEQIRLERLGVRLSEALMKGEGGG